MRSTSFSSGMRANAARMSERYLNLEPMLGESAGKKVCPDTSTTSQKSGSQ